MVAEIDMVTNNEQVNGIQMMSKGDMELLKPRTNPVNNAKEEVNDTEDEEMKLTSKEKELSSGEESNGKVCCNNTYLDLNSSPEKNPFDDKMEKQKCVESVEKEESYKSESETMELFRNENKKEEDNSRSVEQEQMILLMETELLTQNESAINSSLVQLYEETFQSLKDWNEELRVRENLIMDKYLERSKIKEESDEEKNETERSRTDTEATEDLLNEVERSELLLTLVSQEDGETEEDEINADSAIQSETEQLTTCDDMKTNEEKGGVLNEPWTRLKIQKLLNLQYNRCERFRHALVDQKKYLATIAAGERTHFNNIPCKQRTTFKVAGLVVLTIIKLQKMLNEYKENMKLVRKPKMKKKTKRKTAWKTVSTETETSDEESNKSTDKDEPILSIISGNSLKSFEYAKMNNDMESKEIGCTRTLKESPRSSGKLVNETFSVPNHEMKDALPSNDLVVNEPIDKPTQSRHGIPKSYPRPIENSTNAEACVTIHDVTTVPISSKSPRYNKESTCPISSSKCSPNPLKSSQSPCLDLDHSMDYDFDEEDSLSDLYMGAINALQEKLKQVGFYNVPS